MSTRQQEQMIKDAGGFLERYGKHKVYRIGKYLFPLHHGPRQDRRSLGHLKSILRKVAKEKLQNS